MYTHTTFSTAKSLLAARLGDPNKVFWVDAELGAALVEAKRMWNAITLHDREFGQLSTSDGAAFYQLDSLLENADGDLLRSRTLRDRALVSEIQYHLLEVQGLSAWAGTDQFTLSQVLTALQRRRDMFLAETACIVSNRSDDVPAGTEFVDLPDTVIGVRRAVFRDFSGKYTTLRVSDPRVNSEQFSYSIAAEKNLRIRLHPAPQLSGFLETVIVESGSTLDTAANSNTGVLVGVPDDLAWGIKYGALADLLRDGASADPARADACEQLYALAVQLAAKMPVILYAQIDGVKVVPSAIGYTDTAQSGWQGRAKGVPTTLSVVAPDYIALSRTPDSNPHTVGLDVVRTAIVPSTDTEYLEIGREHLDALLGMAQRICMFKVGGAEYAATEPLATNFFAQAQFYSFRRSAASSCLQSILQSSAQAIHANPWMRSPMTVEDIDDEVKSERNARRRPFRKR